jgi:hypothetical protein
MCRYAAKGVPPCAGDHRIEGLAVCPQIIAGAQIIPANKAKLGYLSTRASMPNTGRELKKVWENCPDAVKGLTPKVRGHDELMINLLGRVVNITVQR